MSSTHSATLTTHHQRHQRHQRQPSPARRIMRACEFTLMSQDGTTPIPDPRRIVWQNANGDYDITEVKEWMKRRTGCDVVLPESSRRRSRSERGRSRAAASATTTTATPTTAALAAAVAETTATGLPAIVKLGSASRDATTAPEMGGLDGFAKDLYAVLWETGPEDEPPETRQGH